LGRHFVAMRDQVDSFRRIHPSQRSSFVPQSDATIGNLSVCSA
jgi:hypothetical protein